MTNQTIMSRGATKFTDPPHLTGQPQGAAVSTERHQANWIDGEWHDIIGQIRSFRGLVDDWDGNESIAPSRDLVQAALSLASKFMQCSHPAPARVVAGVNGTISFEYPGCPFTEVEVISVDEARFYEDGRRTNIIAI